MWKRAMHCMTNKLTILLVCLFCHFRITYSYDKDNVITHPCIPIVVLVNIFVKIWSKLKTPSMIPWGTDKLDNSTNILWRCTTFSCSGAWVKWKTDYHHTLKKIKRIQRKTRTRTKISTLSLPLMNFFNNNFNIYKNYIWGSYDVLKIVMGRGWGILVHFVLIPFVTIEH